MAGSVIRSVSKIRKFGPAIGKNLVLVMPVHRQRAMAAVRRDIDADDRHRAAGPFRAQQDRAITRRGGHRLPWGSGGLGVFEGLDKLDRHVRLALPI
jgi:hypothetical protein